MRTPVALSACPDYGPALRDSLERLIGALGGLARFVKPGQSVLVKPNLLTDGTPEQAKTTHPEVVRHLLRVLKQGGARCRVGDSPSTVTKLERVWARTGIGQVCAEEATPLLNLESAGSKRFTVDGMSFSVARPVLEADVVVNVAKLKTHSLTVLTAAVKNLYGTVPGMQKTTLHELYPNPKRFGKLLAALYRTVRPALSIVDGVVGMEGNGPAAGDPVRLGFLAASSDAVALDASLCRMLGIDPARVYYLPEAARAGAGAIRPEHIERVGDTPEPLAPRRFRVPGTTLLQLVPDWAVRLCKPLLWIRPSITGRCVACGRCVQACPAGALAQAKGERPVLDKAACIQCCCCHEVCPERAIVMTASPLLRPFLPSQ
ncbi:MAG: DUF362 domain-containing protein [Kiritimatiellae bacterium]|nr:DUF362 domain-containing protein [Kiritimatiellia bacterium]